MSFKIRKNGIPANVSYKFHTMEEKFPFIRSNVSVQWKICFYPSEAMFPSNGYN